MADFHELEKLKVGDVAVYQTQNGCLITLQRLKGKYPVRNYDCQANTVYDFVNGYTEDPSVTNIKQLYQSLDNDDLIGICSASGRDATADVRLYLASRDYYQHLVSIKAPQESLDTQKRIVKTYLNNLQGYGDAVMVMRRHNLRHVNLDHYKTINDCLCSYLERMKAAIKEECFGANFYDNDGATKFLKGIDVQPMETGMYVGVKDVQREMPFLGVGELTYVRTIPFNEPSEEAAKEKAAYKEPNGPEL